jgi:hypothetical protein
LESAPALGLADPFTRSEVLRRFICTPLWTSPHNQIFHTFRTSVNTGFNEWLTATLPRMLARELQAGNLG